MQKMLNVAVAKSSNRSVRAFGFLLLMAAALMLAGCAQPAVPQDRYYRIVAPAPTNSGIVLAGTVEVERFGAEGLTSGRAIVYVDSDTPDTMQEYNYDFWHKPPADMLRDAIVDYFRASNAARNFVMPEMRADADFLLTGRIQSLETVRGRDPKAIVALELAVTDLRTNTVRLVRSYSADVPARDGSVNAAVAAVNQGVADIFARFLSDLR